MKCSKCQTINEIPANFCSACGTDLRKAKAPAWLWIIVVLLLLTSGGVTYIAYGTYQSIQQGKTAGVASSKQDVPANTQLIDNPAKTEKTEADAMDRVTLIKNVQQKVFTVLTSYGHGSGFLYAKGGYVVTNAHVVDGEVDVRVRNANGQEYEAKVIGISENYDIALLKVPDYAQESPLPLEKKESPIGLEVIAFGSPQGFENTASTGYITGHNRDMQVDRFVYKQIYQLDAQVDQGSSGGPLVDSTNGHVIGINSLLYTSDTSTNFAFSIPLYSMLQYFDQWIQQPMSPKAVLAAAGYYEAYNVAHYVESEPAETDTLLAGQFVQSFRMYYEEALNTSDFSWVADMLTGSAYTELDEYIADIAYEGHTFAFLENNILDARYSDGIYFIDMNETFDFHAANGDYEYFDRYKTYTVITDEYGAFKISAIKIH